MEIPGAGKYQACHQLGFVNIIYCKNLTLCLRDSIV